MLVIKALSVKRNAAAAGVIKCFYAFVSVSRFREPSEFYIKAVFDCPVCHIPDMLFESCCSAVCAIMRAAIGKAWCLRVFEKRDFQVRIEGDDFSPFKWCKPADSCRLFQKIIDGIEQCPWRIANNGDLFPVDAF